MTFTAALWVDAHIDSLPEWQQDICRNVRTLDAARRHLGDPSGQYDADNERQPYGEERALIARAVGMEADQRPERGAAMPAKDP